RCRGAPESRPPSVLYREEKTGVADLGGVLHQLDVEPAHDIVEGAVLHRPSSMPVGLEVVFVQAVEGVAPFLLQPRDAPTDRIRAAGPGHLFPGKAAVAKGMIEGHGPPEIDVPGDPAD